ncbi:hypothetical protein J0910_17265 [Nocardiopsis sp. CNT-189]|uniref:hypothetical protein n=1 Tax=Nocardiopsis oceanisediminis TaxID=2816862 RepID=UPI003B2B29BE
MPRPDQRDARRTAVLLAVLAPTAAIAAWGPLTAMPLDIPAALAGAALAVAVTAGLVWWGSAGIRLERGLVALFLLAWGACVLGSAAGDGLEKTFSRSGPIFSGGWGTSGSFGWFAHTSDESFDPVGAARLEGKLFSEAGAAELHTDEPTGWWTAFLPEGTADGAIVFGWLAGAAAVAAHWRTAPADGPAGPGRTEPEED